MKRLIALEPEVYETLKINKHERPEKKILSELDSQMQNILQSHQPDSVKITLYNEALQKSKLFQKKTQLKTDVKAPLAESSILKTFRKRVKAKKVLDSFKDKRNLSWNEKGQIILDGRKVPGSDINKLIQKSLKIEKPELESIIWESL